MTKNTELDIRIRSLLALTLCLAACGTPETTESIESIEESLSSEPWTDIFSVYKSGSNWRAEYIGPNSVTCPDGSVASGCTVSRIKLGGTGLDASQQSVLQQKIDANGTTEANDAVLLKGSLVRVRDHITNLSWDEFRAVAAYTAPSVRDHTTKHWYLASDGTQQVLRGVNPGYFQLSLPHVVTIIWNLPPGQPHPRFANDCFGTGTVDPQLATATIDQLFCRFQ